MWSVKYFVPHLSIPSHPCTLAGHKADDYRAVDLAPEISSINIGQKLLVLARCMVAARIAPSSIPFFPSVHGA